MQQFLDHQLIDIRKVAEDESCADYIFGCGLWVPDETHHGKNRQHQTNLGRVRIYKSDGEVELLSAMPGDVGERRASATAYKLNKHWQNGEFPRTTQYASG